MWSKEVDQYKQMAKHTLEKTVQKLQDWWLENILETVRLGRGDTYTIRGKEINSR